MLAVCLFATLTCCQPTVEVQAAAPPAVMYYEAPQAATYWLPPRRYRSRVVYSYAPQAVYTVTPQAAAVYSAPPVTTAPSVVTAPPVTTYAPVMVAPETVIIERPVRGPIRRIIRRWSY